MVTGLGARVGGTGGASPIVPLYVVELGESAADMGFLFATGSSVDVPGALVAVGGGVGGMLGGFLASVGFVVAFAVAGGLAVLWTGVVAVLSRRKVPARVHDVDATTQ